MPVFSFNDRHSTLHPNPLHTSSNPSLASLSHSWKLNEITKTLDPISSYMTNFLTWLAGRQEDDFRVRFIFHQSHNAPDVYIQQSRLEWARGPLAALVKPPFVEAASRRVQLCEADDPKSFAVVLKFLNGVQVPLADVHGGVHTLLAAARSAHRWDLSELLRGVCLYLSKCHMLQLTDHLIDAADVATLPGVEPGFVEYFWACVGRRFKEFRTVDGYRVFAAADGGFTTEKAEAIEVPIEVDVCPRFPKLWQLAFEQGMTQTVLKAAIAKEDDEFKEALLQVVLHYFEPKMAEDSAVLDLLILFELKEWDYCDKVLSEGALDSNCTVRAMRLLAKALVASFKAHEDQTGKRKRYVYPNDPYRRYTVRRRPWQDRNRRRLVDVLEEDTATDAVDPYASNAYPTDSYHTDQYRLDPFRSSDPYGANLFREDRYPGGASGSNAHPSSGYGFQNFFS